LKGHSGETLTELMAEAKRRSSAITPVASTASASFKFLDVAKCCRFSASRDDQTELIQGESGKTSLDGAERQSPACRIYAGLKAGTRLKTCALTTNTAKITRQLKA